MFKHGTGPVVILPLEAFATHGTGSCAGYLLRDVGSYLRR